MLQAEAFVSGEGALVAGGDAGTILQCQCGRGKVRAASNGNNDGGWKGLWSWEPVRWARRRWQRRGTRARAWNGAQ
jgi:hypothetical protein